MTGKTSTTELMGYFSHLRKDWTWVGGLLVVTLDGDPVDFAYTDPLDVNVLQRHLLGKRLDSWVLTHGLAVPLLAQTPNRPTVLCFDDPAVLLARVGLGAPVMVVAASDAPRQSASWEALPALDGVGEAWVTAGCREQALPFLTQAASRMAPFGLAEPFQRVRQALTTGAARS
jgi:hypothetical protein